jgi:DNA-binding response OmpR family regulator
MNELILVLVDEKQISNLARDYLERARFSVLSPRDGVTALPQIRFYKDF